ncbi:NAD(P)-dependent alcohol dehydrogenase [Amycolatopsis sp. NPDC058278]|uniref:NAD(P)-dependent alcohol dehydrogenase n=1 Tax=Amycolatopsis sp. NPDC058278 TaxID=3346417 RepID=UPI0036D92B05
MKALVQRAYGPPDTLTWEDVPDPVPGEGEVLVRVCATSVNPYDWHFLRGEPYVARLMAGGFGLRRPPVGVLGCDLAGRVETAGTRFAPGDDVYALLPRGAHAEYVRVREDLLAPMPANLTYEQAAAMPMAAVTALLALRGAGAGQRVLVNGASGGVGTFAVQLAKALGAEVDAVCGAANAEVVRSLGADHVFDYRVEDFTRSGRRYDVLLDIAGSRSLFACRRVLARNGTFVAVGGPAGRWVQPAGHVFAALASGPLTRRRVVLADTVACRERRPSSASWPAWWSAVRSRR